jgi:hypothetical protein
VKKETHFRGTSIAVPTSPLAPLLPRPTSPLLPAQGGERARERWSTTCSSLTIPNLIPRVVPFQTLTRYDAPARSGTCVIGQLQVSKVAGDIAQATAWLRAWPEAPGLLAQHRRDPDAINSVPATLPEMRAH